MLILHYMMSASYRKLYICMIGVVLGLIPPLLGLNRVYYIATVETEWNFAPHGIKFTQNQSK